MTSGGAPRDAHFSPVDYEAWRERIEEELGPKGFERLRTRREGSLLIEPLYAPDSPAAPRLAPGLPGVAPFVRGMAALAAGEEGWIGCTEIDDGDAARAADLLARDVARGARGVLLRLDPATRLGEPGASLPGRGVALESVDELTTLLGDAPLELLYLAFDAGLATRPLAEALGALAGRLEVDAEELRGDLGLDPLATLAELGRLPGGLEAWWAEAARLLEEAGDALPSTRALAVSGVPYAHAGASAPLELGAALAAGVETLRALDARGASPETVTPRLVMRLALGRDVFIEIAKLRAARLLWNRVLEASGVEEDQRGLAIHARGSSALRQRHDPFVNMLRATLEVFAGAVGGAEIITAPPFDEALGVPDAFARRLAAQLHVVLAEEGRLARVADPAGGSWFVESLTEQIAERAWQELQRIESEGGLSQSLAAGALQARVDEEWSALSRTISTRRVPIVGVSLYPRLDEKLPERAKPGPATGRLAELAARRAGDAPASEARPLPLRRHASPFESLRAASERAREEGRAAGVFLASVGSIPEHRPRTDFARQLLEAGGIAPLLSEGYEGALDALTAYKQSGHPVAFICSSDERYPELVPDLARGLRAAGARRVVVAGRPGEHEEAWREAGVSDFVHLGMDAVAFLEDLLDELGVSR